MGVESPSQLTSLILQALNELAILQKEVGNLQAQASIIIVDQGRGADSRTRIHETLSEVSKDLAVLKKTVERIAPLVDEHEQKHQRGLGIVWLIRTGWFVCGGIIVAVFAKMFGMKFPN